MIDHRIQPCKMATAEKTDLADGLRSTMEDTAAVQRFSIRGLAADYRTRGHLAVAGELPREFAFAKNLEML